MICLITGVPGSGKSLALVKRYIIPALIKGRRIYTNLDGLNDPSPNPYILALSFASGVPPEDVEKLIFSIPEKDYNRVLSTMPAGAIAVIDEAQIFWNSRDYSTDNNKNILPYFQKHRHYGHDIILATQHFEQLDSGIRRLAEIHYRLKRMRNIGLNMVVKVSVFSQGLSIEVKPVASEAWTIDKSIFGCYKSYENNKIAEVKYKSHNVFMRSPLMWVCFLFFVYFAYYVWSGQLSALMRGEVFLKGRGVSSSSFDPLSDSPSPGVPSRNTINDYFSRIYTNGEIVTDYWCHRKLYTSVMDYKGVMYNDSLPYNLIPKEICPSFGFLLSKEGVSL
jgi:zona occludens toxin (predicted ATPase)